MILLSTIRKLWPNGNSKVPGLMEGIVSQSYTVFDKYGLTNNLLVAHAMAQFSHECGAGTEMVENINYSAVRACQVWPTRFSSEADVYAKTGSYAGDPQFHIKLIDLVYGNRMGNRPGTHDGSMYIGRGLSQCTGREGYQKLGTTVGIDLLNSPSLINVPQNALECGVADFILCGCLPYAKADDVAGVTKKLNGGYIGLQERKDWLAKWKVALMAQVPMPSPPIAPVPPQPVPAPQTGWIAALIKAILSIFRRG